MKKTIMDLYDKGFSRKDISSKLMIPLKATQSIIDRHLNNFKKKQKKLLTNNKTNEILFTGEKGGNKKYK